MIQIILLVILIMFKESMNSVLWWILMAVDIIATALGILGGVLEIIKVNEERRRTKQLLISRLKETGLYKEDTGE